MELANLEDGIPIGGISAKSFGDSSTEHYDTIGIVKSKHSSHYTKTKDQPLLSPVLPPIRAIVTGLPQKNYSSD